MDPVVILVPKSGMLPVPLLRNLREKCNQDLCNRDCALDLQLLQERLECYKDTHFTNIYSKSRFPAESQYNSRLSENFVLDGVSSSWLVQDLNKVVWVEYQLERFHIAPSELKLYASQGNFNEKLALEITDNIIGLGTSRTDPVVIVLPQSASMISDLELPQKKQRTKSPAPPLPKWKDDVPYIPSLENDTLYFVDRTDAISQLQAIHSHKYNRATTGVGLEWVIPIADHIWDLGKSSFWRNYIRKSRETWPIVAMRTPFQQTLCDSRTVYISFDRGELSKKPKKVMMKRLIKALKPMFDVAPSVLYSSTKAVDSFMEQLTKEAGPVFIVLNEIGHAFHSTGINIFQEREKFFQFCGNVISKWFQLEQVFFVLLGRGSLFNHATLRPSTDFLAYNFVFERLKLNLLQQESIVAILKNTLHSDGQTISSSLGLSDSEVIQAADCLFLQTNGLPRALTKALIQCRSFSNILEYDEPLHIPESNWTKFCDWLVCFKEPMKKLLESSNLGTTINMNEMFLDAGGQPVSMDLIATNACVIWEGTAEKARVRFQPILKEHVEALLFPLTDYIRYIIDYQFVSDNILEWIFLKRFQELFSSPGQPRLVLPDFFDTPIFGDCTGVNFSPVTRPLPKITDNGAQLPDIDSITASPRSWSSLVSKIDYLAAVCLKPRQKSASSDGFLITNVIHHAKAVKLCCGLVVKNFSTIFSVQHLNAECKLFNRVFDGTNCEGRLQILFICCTHYARELSDKFVGNSFVSISDKAAYPNIDEIILLNLETSKHRAAFFGTDEVDSRYIEKIVSKSEAEYLNF
ncbi:hypothetical protein BCR33DRAFT_846407 [Rhizoclosmatium globosum]|uniref:Uncharacterized protein n=1 Tax=Rhizoclosmatium globosum TaxID=329046 RepID=A0A1Y2CXB1_9FUNG|nr:hypothetical protein BCR33DRAFT_846407 [Rhizoclosmatium globosum]|eukprot:ORY51660.1 hypothetical protein BCR33DRAFT_846407 [Rhizoclosmatium globosum]